MRTSPPSPLTRSKSALLPGTRSMSPNEQKITSGRAAMASAWSIISSGVTQTGQPGPWNEFDFARQQLVNPVADDRVRLPAAHLHHHPGLLGRRVDVFDSALGARIAAARSRKTTGRTASSQAQSMPAATANAVQAAAAAASRPRSVDPGATARATPVPRTMSTADQDEAEDAELAQRLEVEGVGVADEAGQVPSRAHQNSKVPGPMPTSGSVALASTADCQYW